MQETNKNVIEIKNVTKDYGDFKLDNVSFSSHITGDLEKLADAPLTVIGHNFGTDYPGFPWRGILHMCIFCILDGVILTFVTEMSGSIWPAAILHVVNNANPTILSGYINRDKSEWNLPVSSGWIASCISLGVVVTVLLIL